MPKTEIAEGWALDSRHSTVALDDETSESVKGIKNLPGDSETAKTPKDDRKTIQNASKDTTPELRQADNTITADYLDDIVAETLFFS